MFSLLLMTAAMGHSDPSHIVPDPSPLEQRVTDLETRMQRLENLLLASQPKVVPVPAKTAPTVVPPGMHAHRKLDGTIIVHGNENLGNAQAHEGIAHPWPRIAEAGQTVTNTSIGSSYSATYSIQSSGCPNGVCPTPSSRSGWYLGKNLGR